MRIRTGIRLSLVLMVSLACADGAPEPARNLLLVTLDTLRADRLGVYGYPRPTSPEIDAYAGGATVFEDVTCSVPTTLPSHWSIFTGLRPFEHGVRRNGERPERDLVTIFDLLAARGAATAGVIGAKVMAGNYLRAAGFERVVMPKAGKRFQVSGSRVADRAIVWLERNHQAPFALWVHFYDTHEPYTPPTALARKFDRGYAGPLPDRLETKQLLAFNDVETGGALTAADLEHIGDLYDAEVAYLDRQVGRLLSRLDQLGRGGDTLVAIVGDHGQALGERGFFGHGYRLLEPVVKVPLLLRHPGIVGGRRIAEPVETVDLLPTLAELLGVEPPEGLSGRSLVPLLRGKSIEPRRFRLIERRPFDDEPEVRAIALHGGDWKAIHYSDRDGSERRLLGLAESGLDGENHYAPEDREAEWLDSALEVVYASPHRRSELDDEERRMLESLGYLD